MYPLCLNLHNRLCVVIGGGAVAARKVQGLQQADARIRLISPEITSGLHEQVCHGELEWLQRPYLPGDLHGARLAFAATNDPAVQEAVRREAVAAGILLNMADRPEACDFQIPAVLRREELTIAVSTSGGSPAAAAAIRQRLDELLGPEYTVLLRLLASIRRQLPRENSSPRQRQALFQQLLQSDLPGWIRRGDDNAVRSSVHELFGPAVHLDPEDLHLE